MVATTASLKRWRGVILELVYDGHRKQQSRLDYLSLWGLMRDLGHDVGLNDVITLCQQLRDRGHMTYREERNRFTNQVELYELQISPKGCDLIEKNVPADPAILLL